MKRKQCKTKECSNLVWARGLCKTCDAKLNPEKYRIKKSVKPKKKGGSNSQVKRKRLKVIPLSKLDKLVWKFTSLAYRLQDSDEIGECQCATCPTVLYYIGTKKMHMGHFQSRRFKNTKFERKNQSSQCATCNGPGNNGRPYEMGVYLNRKYGSGTAEKMIEQSRISVKWGRLEYKEKLLEVFRILEGESNKRNIWDWKDYIAKWELKLYEKVISENLTINSELQFNGYKL